MGPMGGQRDMVVGKIAAICPTGKCVASGRSKVQLPNIVHLVTVGRGAHKARTVITAVAGILILPYVLELSEQKGGNGLIWRSRALTKDARIGIGINARR